MKNNKKRSFKNFNIHGVYFIFRDAFILNYSYEKKN